MKAICSRLACFWAITWAAVAAEPLATCESNAVIAFVSSSIKPLIPDRDRVTLAFHSLRYAIRANDAPFCESSFRVSVPDNDVSSSATNLSVSSRFLTVPLSSDGQITAPPQLVSWTIRGLDIVKSDRRSLPMPRQSELFAQRTGRQIVSLATNRIMNLATTAILAANPALQRSDLDFRSLSYIAEPQRPPDRISVRFRIPDMDDPRPRTKPGFHPYFREGRVDLAISGEVIKTSRSWCAHGIVNDNRQTKDKKPSNKNIELDKQ